MKTILEEPNVHVYLDEETATIVVQWKGEANFPDFKFANEHALLFATKGNVKRLLIDQSELNNPDFKTRTWTIMSFLPRVFTELGFDSKVAVIPADLESTFTKMISSIKTDSLFHISEDSKEANRWLTA